jgi:hypothetical protein
MNSSVRNVSLAATLSACLILAACGGPERAPSQPIPGVDVAHPEGANPYDSSAGPGIDTFLGNFVPEVAAALEKEKGPGGQKPILAVFPALTHDADRGVDVVNGLGEHFAEETAAKLVDAGVSVLAGSDLVTAIRSANISLAAYASAADALPVAEAIKADYVVAGRVDRKVFDVHKRDELLKVDWTCRKVKDGQLISRYKVDLAGGPLAGQLMRYYDLRSEWEDAVRLEPRQGGAPPTAAGGPPGVPSGPAGPSGPSQ